MVVTTLNNNNNYYYISGDTSRLKKGKHWTGQSLGQSKIQDKDADVKDPPEKDPGFQ